MPATGSESYQLKDTRRINHCTTAKKELLDPLSVDVPQLVRVSVRSCIYNPVRVPRTYFFMGIQWTHCAFDEHTEKIDDALYGGFTLLRAT